MKLSPTAQKAFLAATAVTLLASLGICGFLLYSYQHAPIRERVVYLPSTANADTWPNNTVNPNDIYQDAVTTTVQAIDLEMTWQTPERLSTSTAFIYRLQTTPPYDGMEASDEPTVEVEKRGTVATGYYKNWRLVTSVIGYGMGGADMVHYLLPPENKPDQDAYLVEYRDTLDGNIVVTQGEHEDLLSGKKLFVKTPNFTFTLPNGKALTTDSENPGISWGEPWSTEKSNLSLTTKEGYPIHYIRGTYYYVSLPGGRSAEFSDEASVKLVETLQGRNDDGTVTDAIGLKNTGIKNNLSFHLGGLDTKNAGCGGASSIVYVDSTPKDTDSSIIFKSSDLEAIKGLNTSTTLYRVKNLNHPSYKKAYELWYQASWDEQAAKPTFEEFMKQNDLPFMLFKDSFGQWQHFVADNVGIVAECGKPVIYLYPTATTTVSVKLPPSINVTVSEPTYPRQGWSTVATPEGKLTMKDGSTFTSLFWEGTGASYKAPTTGFIVKGNDIETFLPKTLAAYGLNAQEAKEFMDFWVPIMKPYNTVRISFVTDEWSKNVPLSVTPKPDTNIRLFMDWSPVSADATIAAPHITTPKRDGFTLVEWGGLLRK